jgi:hypothetical protein
LSTLASRDKKDLLQVLSRDNVQRKVTWQWNSTEEIHRESRWFKEFEPSLLNHMKNEEITFHYHTYGVSLEDYQSIQSLQSFFKLISTDVAEDNREYITGMEAREHSIYATMYHPEYQLMNFLSE